MPRFSARAKSSRWAAVVGGFTARASPSSSKKAASAGMSCGVPRGSPSGGGGGAAGSPVSALKRSEARLAADGGDVGDVGLVLDEEPSEQEDLRCGRLDPVGAGRQLAVPARRGDHPGAGAAAGRTRPDVGERLGPGVEELVREVAIGDLGQREHHRLRPQVEHGDRVQRVAVGRHDGAALRSGQTVLPEQAVDADQTAQALQGAHRHDERVARHVRVRRQLGVGHLFARRSVDGCVAAGGSVARPVARRPSTPRR